MFRIDDIDISEKINKKNQGCHEEFSKSHFLPHSMLSDRGRKQVRIIYIPIFVWGIFRDKSVEIKRKVNLNKRYKSPRIDVGLIQKITELRRSRL